MTWRRRLAHQLALLADRLHFALLPLAPDDYRRRAALMRLLLQAGRDARRPAGGRRGDRIP